MATSSWRDRRVSRSDLKAVRDEKSVAPPHADPSILVRSFPVEVVDSDLLVSQLGNFRRGRASFRNKPRFDKEWELSVVSGELTISEITTLVMGHSGAATKSAVRHLQVGALRHGDYLTHRTPTQRIRRHCSIIPNIEDPRSEAAKGVWERSGKVALRAATLKEVTP